MTVGVMIYRGDASDAGGIAHNAADAQGDLLLDDAFVGAAKCHICILGLCLVVQGGRFALFYGDVKTLDGGSTFCLTSVKLQATVYW